MPAPSTMPNLAAWFVGGVGITSAGGLVSQWADQSGNGRHLKQATGTNQPALQADGTILFDGVDNFMKCDAFTFNQPETIYFLGRQVTWINNSRIWDGDTDNTSSLIGVTASPQLAAFAAAGGTPSLTTSDVVVNSYCVISVVYNNTAGVVQVNNLPPATGSIGTTNAGGFTLARSGAGAAGVVSNIQVKEVILFAAAHDAPTRAGVIAYLNGSEAQAAARNIGGGPARSGYRFTPYIPRRFPKKRTTR